MKKSPLLVLMYHGLHEHAAEPGFDPRYSVHPSEFAAHLRLLRNSGLEEWDATLPPPARPSFLLTFDDGDATNESRALPLLQASGLGAVFFITSGFIGKPGMLSWLQLRHLASSGMTIGSHGKTHRFLSCLDEKEITHELEESRRLLAAATGQPVDLLSLPGGRTSSQVAALASSCGYRTVFGSTPGLNLTPGGELPLRRVAITRQMDQAAFAQVLAWKGPAVSRICLRHHALSWPKRLLGDERFDRLRQAWVA